jgi:hypothetical protein
MAADKIELTPTEESAAVKVLRQRIHDDYRPESIRVGNFRDDVVAVIAAINACREDSDPIGTVRARGLGVAMKCRRYNWVHCGDGKGTYEIAFDRIADWAVIYRPGEDTPMPVGPAPWILRFENGHTVTVPAARVQELAIALFEGISTEDTNT